MTIRKATSLIIVHCSATPPSMDIGEREIDKWHRQRGFFGIGYHYVVRRSGVIEDGRPLDQIGAHAKPWNDHSVGICMVGGVTEADRKTPEANFTPEQFDAARNLIEGLLQRYPEARVIGHRDVPGVAKACPSFDANKWWLTNVVVP